MMFTSLVIQSFVNSRKYRALRTKMKVSISLFIIILIVEVNYVVKCTNYIMFDEPYQDIIDTKE